MIYALYHPEDWTQHPYAMDNWGIMVFSLYTQSETMSGDYNKIFFDGGLLPVNSPVAFRRCVSRLAHRHDLVNATNFRTTTS